MTLANSLSSRNLALIRVPFKVENKNLQEAYQRNLPFSASVTLTQIYRLCKRSIAFVGRYFAQIDSESTQLFCEPFYKNPNIDRFANLPKEMIRRIAPIMQAYEKETKLLVSMIGLEETQKKMIEYNKQYCTVMTDNIISRMKNLSARALSFVKKWDYQIDEKTRRFLYKPFYNDSHIEVLLPSEMLPEIQKITESYPLEINNLALIIGFQETQRYRNEIDENYRKSLFDRIFKTMISLSDSAVFLVKQYRSQIKDLFLFYDPYYKSLNVECFLDAGFPDEMIQKIREIAEEYRIEMNRLESFVGQAKADQIQVQVDKNYNLMLASMVDGLFDP